MSTWTCARCFGMLLGVVVGSIVWRSAWNRVALHWLIASALVNGLQHWSSLDPAPLRAVLGIAFGLGWIGVMLGAMSARLRARVAAVALVVLIAGGLAFLVGPAWLRGSIEISGYGLMLGTFVLAAWCWARGTVTVDDDPLASR